jgi:tetratricopeptide (TPR) repeat protein
MNWGLDLDILGILEGSEAIMLNPDDAKAYFSRGLAYFFKGDYDSAIADYTQAIALDPGDAKAYRARGNACRFKGDYDNAIADYTQATKLKPDYDSAYYNRGEVYHLKGDFDSAIADYTQVIALDHPVKAHDSVRVFKRRGSAYFRKGSMLKAMGDYVMFTVRMATRALKNIWPLANKINTRLKKILLIEYIKNVVIKLFFATKNKIRVDPESVNLNRQSIASLNAIASLNDNLGSFISDGKILDFEKMLYGAGYGKKYTLFGKINTTYVTVLIYHGGNIDLKYGIESKGFKDMYAKATSEKNLGAAYHDIRDQKDTSAIIQDVPFRRYQFTGKNKFAEKEEASTLFMTVYNGALLKVRINYPLENREEAKYVDEFMNALVSDLKGAGA